MACRGSGYVYGIKIANDVFRASGNRRTVPKSPGITRALKPVDFWHLFARDAVGFRLHDGDRAVWVCPSLPPSVRGGAPRAVPGKGPPWRRGRWHLSLSLSLQGAPVATRWSRSGGTPSGTWRPTRTPWCRSTSGGSTPATCSWSCAAPGPPWARGPPRTAWLAAPRGLCTGRACHPWPSCGPQMTKPWSGGSRKGSPWPSLVGRRG